MTRTDLLHERFDRDRGVCVALLSVVVHRNIRCSGYFCQGYAVLETEGARASNPHNAVSRPASPNAVRVSVGGSLCGRSRMVRPPPGNAGVHVYQKDGTI